MTKITYIPGEIANAAIDEHGNRKPVTRTQHIFDDAKGKSQAEVNTDVDSTLALHQSEINALDSQKYVTVSTYAGLPATGEVDTIYRVSSWDGTQVDATKYAEYAWKVTGTNTGEYVLLDVKTQVGEVYDISEAHSGQYYEDLTAALGTNGEHVPQSLRKGGMSVKFIQGSVPSSDNNYVQWRYMGTTVTGTPNPFLDTANWQGVDKELITGSHNLAESGVVVKYIKENTIEETVEEVADTDVAGYITDRNKVVIAKVMKDGSVEWFVKTRSEISYEQRLDTIEELLSYVSTELPDSETNIIKYLTDNKGVIIATISNKGEVQFTAGGGFDGESTHQQYIGFNAIKVLTDKRGILIGWITREGKVHIENLEVVKLEGNVADSIPNWLQPIINIAGGEHNSDYINDDTYDYVDKHKAEINIEGMKKNTIPMFVLQDDDTIDPQLPTSYIPDATPSTEPTSYNITRGGYASLLLPVLLAFNAKYGDMIKGKAVCGLAAEGQRIGLTSLQQLTDDFDGNLNNNGQIVNKIVEKAEWEVMCHSMTARYLNNSYLVEGLDSEFANSLLVGAVYTGTNGLGWGTTTCYDTVTKKNYKVKQDLSGWDECPLHYAKPYLAVSKASNSRLVINPTYSVKYQVGTWFERAKIAGLKNVDRVGVKWGSSHSIWHMREDMKYADVMFNISETPANFVPVDSMIERIGYTPKPAENGITEYTDYYNVYNDYDYQRLCNAINLCKSRNGLTVFVSHINTAAGQNKYWPASYGFNYPTRTEPSEIGKLDYYDANYPSEWYVPLNFSELQDMLTNENSVYWTTPPQRLGIQSWADFYPCPGTTLAMLWDVMRYAMDNGVYFGTSKEAIKMFGNKLAIGVCREQEGSSSWPADARLGSIPEQNKSYCVIGADGSIRYSSKYKNY